MDRDVKEGDVYKILTAFGREFILRYGYYDDKERQSRWAEPTPIYPDFVKEPVYTENGEPFVTEMQDACDSFSGENVEDGCFGCKYYRRGDEFLGICVSINNRKKE